MNAASGMTLDLLPRLDLPVWLEVLRQISAARRVKCERRPSWVDWPYKFESESPRRSIEALRDLYRSLPRRAAPSIDVQYTDNQTRDEALCRLAPVQRG